MSLKDISLYTFSDTLVTAFVNNKNKKINFVNNTDPIKYGFDWITDIYFSSEKTIYKVKSAKEHDDELTIQLEKVIDSPGDVKFAGFKNYKNTWLVVAHRGEPDNKLNAYIVTDKSFNIKQKKIRLFNPDIITDGEIKIAIPNSLELLYIFTSNQLYYVEDREKCDITIVPTDCPTGKTCISGFCTSNKDMPISGKEDINDVVLNNYPPYCDQFKTYVLCANQHQRRCKPDKKGTLGKDFRNCLSTAKLPAGRLLGISDRQIVSKVIGMDIEYSLFITIYQGGISNTVEKYKTYEIIAVDFRNRVAQFLGTIQKPIDSKDIVKCDIIISRNNDHIFFNLSTDESMYNDELYYSILNTSGVISNSAFKRIYSDNGLYNRSNIVHLGNDIIFQNIDDNKITTYGINVSSGVSVITKKGESSSYNSTYAHLEALEDSLV